MAETNFRGPIFGMGSIEDGRLEPMDGPSLSYQWGGFPDVRSFPARKDGLYPRRVASYLDGSFIILVDNVPNTSAAAGLAALANAVSGTAMTLVTVAPGNATAGNPSLGTAVPILPSGTTTPVNVLAMDFGFTTGTTVAASATVTVPDSTQFALGEWVLISGAGNSAKTASLFTQVMTAPTATTITVSPIPSGSLTGAPIGHAGAPGSAWLGTPVSVGPHYTGGLGAFWCPQEGLSRCVSITGVVNGLGGAFLVKGYDVYMRSMSETITAGAGVNTVYGQKAFKYIASITPQFADAHTYSAGWGDTFGTHFRSLLFEHMDINWGGLVPVIGTGWLAGVTTTATATTGDVRGTVQVGANGNGSALASPVGASANNALRLVIAQRVTPWQGIFSTPLNSVPLYGVPQF